MNAAPAAPRRTRDAARAAPWAGPLLAAASAMLLLQGCAASSAGTTGAAAAAAQRVTERLCAPRAESARGGTAVVEAPLPPEARQAAAGELAARGFSRTAIEIAGDIGALDLLRRYAALETDGGASRGGGAERELRRLRLRQGITDRVLLAMSDIASTQAEIDCEGERGDGLRERLQKAENRRSRRLGLASVMIGALTAAATGGLSLAGAATSGDIAGIVGGVAEASAAGSLLFGDASGGLRNERNLLGEIWERPARPVLFPGSVWRFLNRRPVEDPAAPSRAERLVAELRADERLGARGSAEEGQRMRLLFGPGGTFTLEDLELRDTSLDLLETNIAAMNQELRVLLEELTARLPPGASHRAAR